MLNLKKRNVAQFMSSEPVGMVLRVHAPRPSQVSDRVTLIEKAVRQTCEITVDGKKLFRRYDIMVWTDPAYAGESDCGETAQKLREVFRGTDLPVFIHEVSQGELFVDSLNDAIAEQSFRGMQWSLILSAEALSYATSEKMCRIVTAACSGARVVGVALNELTQSIMEGRIANTFAMWHIRSLQGVGGFDHRAALPLNREERYYLRGWSFTDDKQEFYSCEGVEEIYPLARLGCRFGACIAPIASAESGTYTLPTNDAAIVARHQKKMASKERRQRAHAHEAGVDFEFLKGCVMPEFRTF